MSQEEKIVDLSNVKDSFVDQLQKYEAIFTRQDLDPEALAQARLDIIKAAKQAIDDKTSPEAKRWYGECLATGYDGFPVHLDQGIKILNEAVMMRSKKAHEVLGDIYSAEIAELEEEKIDFEKAIKHYEQADSGYGCFRLAMIYSDHESLKDIRKALDYAEKSAFHFNDNMGKSIMAVWHYFGDFIPQKFEKAHELFKEVYESEKLPDGGYKTWAGATSLFYLGLMMYNGEHVTEDDHRGFLMIEEAAQLGEPNALEWMQGYHEYHGQ